MNKLKFFVIKYKDDGEILTDLIKLGGFKSGINRMISFEMTKNFLVCMHEGNQISIFSFYDGIKYIGAINFKFALNSDSGLLLFEQKYRMSIVYVSRQSSY